MRWRVHGGVCFGLGLKIAAPPDGVAYARPARTPLATALRLTSFGGYQPAVFGRPTSMILTRAHRSSDLLRKRASPGGYFTRALYAGSQNHAGPANVLSCASRLSGLCVTRRSSLGTATALRLKTACRRNTPTARLSGFALGYPLATLGPHFVRRLLRAWLLHTRRLDPTFH